MNPVLIVLGIAFLVVAAVAFFTGLGISAEADSHWVRHTRGPVLRKLIADRAEKNGQWDRDDMVAFNDETAKIVAKNTEAIAARTRRQKLIGNATAVIAVLAGVAVLGAGIHQIPASAFDGGARQAAKEKSMAAQVVRQYGLPGRIDLDKWKYSRSFDFFGGRISCPADLYTCYNGSILARDGSIQNIYLIVTNHGPILTDANGVELPHPAAK